MIEAIFIAWMSMASIAPPEAVPAYSGQPRIAVIVKSSIPDETLPGTTVDLCPIGPNGFEPRHEAKCRTQVADAHGQVTFNDVKPGRYAVSAMLTGFATTSIYPLPIGGTTVGPDVVMVVLNPLCYDCGPSSVLQ